jgi:hypothetical protein
MTDRELLEAAAKAAGMTVEWDGDGLVIASKFRGHLTNYDAWNPLFDDGDALRLAVALGMIVDSHGLHTRISLPFAADVICHETHNGDKLAATRRAIVRAAAAMAA